MTCTAVGNCFFILTFGRLRQFLASPLDYHMTDKKEHIKHSMKSTAPADCVTEIRIGNSVLVVSGFFKQSATETAADKMAKVLEAEAATQKSAI